jgi:hypothetical protein
LDPETLRVAVAAKEVAEATESGADPSAALPNEKVTAPVGAAPPAAAVTVAVNWAVPAAAMLAGDAVRLVVVTIGTPVTVTVVEAVEAPKLPVGA